MKRVILFVFFFYIFVSLPCYKAQWNYTDVASIEDALLNGKIVSCEPIRLYLRSIGKECDFDNEVYLVLLQDGSKAVFKPSDDRFAEVAAYKASRELNLGLVPPTVLRKINDRDGSLQLFVESDIDLLKGDSSQIVINEKIMDTARLFCFIFGQWDMNSGNRITYRNGEMPGVALIDNAGIYNQQQVRYGDYSFVRVAYSDQREDDFIIPFPFEHAITLKNPGIEEVHEAFQEFFTYEKRVKMWKRYHKKSITYCIWRNGLWIQYYKNQTEMRPHCITSGDLSLLQPYKALTRKILEIIWSDALKYADKRHVNRLIDLTLQRRDQVLNILSQ